MTSTIFGVIALIMLFITYDVNDNARVIRLFVGQIMVVCSLATGHLADINVESSKQIKLQTQILEQLQTDTQEETKDKKETTNVE